MTLGSIELASCYQRDFTMVATRRSSGTTATKTVVMKKTTKSSPSQWASLPTDILQRIANQHLPNIVDWSRLAAVCKGWQLAVGNLLPPPTAEPPWLLTPLRKSKEPIKLYQSVACARGKPCAILCEVTKRCRQRLSGARLLESKFGWLLLAARGRGGQYRYLLWSPFTSNKVKEAQLPPILELSFPLVTFSCSPNSPDCVFVTVHTASVVDEEEASCTCRGIRIETCKLGDDSWDKHVFKHKAIGGIAAITLMQGTLYVLFRDGSLGGFNLDNKSWTLLIYTKGTQLRDAHSNDRYLFELGGELLQLVLNEDWLRVFKFDPCGVTWVEGDVDDRVVFLNFVRKSSVAVPAVGEMAKLSGRVYMQKTVWLTRGGTRSKLFEIREDCKPDLYGTEVPEDCQSQGIWVMPPYCCK